MPDNRDITSGADRRQVAGREGYEVRVLASRHGMTPDEVRDMIERIGNDRDALEREAAKLRRH